MNNTQGVTPEGSLEGTLSMLHILLELRKVHRAVLVNIILSEKVVEVTLGVWGGLPAPRPPAL